MAFPNATIYNLDGDGIKQVQYDDVEHVAVTKAFLSNPESFLHRL